MRIVRNALVLMVLAVALAGCAAATPSTSPSPELPAASGTPIPTVGPTVLLVLGGAELVEHDAEGAESARHSLSEPRAILSLLTDLFGEPQTFPPTAEDAAEGCTVTLSAWSDQQGDHAITLLVWPSDTLLVMFQQPELLGVELAASTGLQVGDDASATLAALPASQLDADGVAFLYDVAGEREDGEQFGGVAYHDGSGIVGSLVSPFVPVATDIC